MVNTALSAKKKNHSSKRKGNSGCQLAAFWVTGSTNPQGFGSVAPNSSKGIVMFRGVI